MKYLSTPITCIEMPRDGFNVRVEFTFKNDNRITISYIQWKVIPIPIEDGKNELKYWVVREFTV